MGSFLCTAPSFALEQTTRLLTGHTNEILAIAFSPDGHLIASTGTDQTIRLRDSDRGLDRGDEDSPGLGNPSTPQGLFFTSEIHVCLCPKQRGIPAATLHSLGWETKLLPPPDIAFDIQFISVTW